MLQLCALIALCIWAFGWSYYIKKCDEIVTSLRTQLEGMVIGFCFMVVIAFFGGVATLLIQTALGV